MGWLIGAQSVFAGWPRGAVVTAAGLLGGLLALLFGGWMIWWLRRKENAEGAGKGDGGGGWYGRLEGWGLGLTIPTRMVVGVVGLVWGYELVAWVVPANWLRPLVPVEKWWVLVLVTGVAVTMSLWLDRRERIADERDAGKAKERGGEESGSG